MHYNTSYAAATEDFSIYLDVRTENQKTRMSGKDGHIR